MRYLIHRLWTPVCLLLTATCASFAATTEIETFDLPQSPWPGFQDLVIDEAGVPWVLANNHVYYLEGDTFVAFERAQLSSGQYLTGLFGGPERGAYLTQPGEKDHEGKLYRLNAGKYEQVTTFYYDAATNRPGLYVSKDGRLFNWGQRFLAVFGDGVWKRVEAQFGSQAFRPVICDFGDDVYFYSVFDNRIYYCNASSELTVTEGPAGVSEQLEQRKRQVTHPGPVTTSSWNGDRVFVLFHRPMHVLAFDIRTNEPVEVKLPPTLAQKLSFSDAYETNSGSLWLIARLYGASEYTFYELTPDGKLNELSATRGINWSSSRRLQHPNSILQTGDGHILLGLPEFGIAIYRSGELTRLDWRHGFHDGVTNMQEGPDGAIWLPHDRAGRKMARLTLNSEPPPTTDIAKDWKEYKLVPGSHVWTLSDDTIAMFDMAHPEKLARWTRGDLSLQEMPFEVARIYRSVVDDRGHLFVTVHPGRTFDIGAEAVAEYDNIKDALASAVESGAKHFRGSPDFGGVILSDDKRLWLGMHNFNTVEMLEDDTWTTFRFRDDVYYLFESSDNGPIIRTQGGTLYRYNTGQIEELPTTLGSRRDLMLGPKELQPFDKAFITQNPRQYYPVLRNREGVRLYFDIAEFERALEDPQASPSDRNSVELPRHFAHVVASRSYGGWLLMSQGAGAPYRIVMRQMWKLDFSETPLSGMSILDVVEAADGDVWFQTYVSGHPRAFRLLQSQLSLESPQITEKCGRELRVPVQVKPERLNSTIELFVTVNGEHQTANRTPAGEVVFRFPSSGTYQCTIDGIRLGATMAKPVEFSVDAAVSLPETNWTASATEVTVTTLEWQPPVTATPSDDSRQAQLAWRFEEEAWQQFGDEQTISLVDRPPGTYRIAFRATEDEYWHDQSPVFATVHYEPDYESIVHDLARQLITDDLDVQRKAIERMEQLGLRAIPQLEREIEAAEKAIQMLPKLRKIQQRIEQAERQRQEIE